MYLFIDLSLLFHFLFSICFNQLQIPAVLLGNDQLLELRVCTNSTLLFITKYQNAIKYYKPLPGTNNMQRSCSQALSLVVARIQLNARYIFKYEQHWLCILQRKQNARQPISSPEPAFLLVSTEKRTDQEKQALRTRMRVNLHDLVRIAAT